MLAPAARFSAGSDGLSSTCRRTEIWREMRVAGGSALEFDVLKHETAPQKDHGGTREIT